MKSRILYKFTKQHSVLIILIFTYIFFYIISSFLLFIFENNLNERCKSLLDSFWLNTVFIFSGFEDFGPKTTIGKIISFISFIVGLATITIITGKIASTFVISMLKERKMNKNLSGHITICNWNDGGEKIIKEIHAPQAEPDVEIVVLTKTEVAEEQLRNSPEFEKVYFIRCDPMLHNTLKASRITEAKSVIILAEPTALDPDATSAMIALAISKICPTDKRPHIIVEAINHRKMEHLLDAGVDEIICATDFEYGIIAQCSVIGKFGKLSQVYQQLLTYSADTNEFYIIPSSDIPSILIGKSFCDACVLFSKNRNPNNPLILVGLVRNGEVILNPRHFTDHGTETGIDLIRESDGLIVMAYDKPGTSNLSLKI